MTTLQLAWHQAKKDIRHRRPTLLLWLLILFAYVVVSYLAADLNGDWERFEPWESSLFKVTSLITVFLTFITINADTPYNSGATYLTRPVGWKAVAAAKLLIVGIFFVVLPAAGDCVVAFAYGERSRLLLVFVSGLAGQAFIAAPALALGAASRGLTGAISSVVIAGLLLGLGQFIIWKRYVAVIVSDYWGASFGEPLLIAASGLLLVGSAIVCLAYRKRNWWATLGVVSVVFFIFPTVHLTFGILGLSARNYIGDDPILKVGESLTHEGARDFHNGKLEWGASAYILPPEGEAGVVWVNAIVDAYPKSVSSDFITHYDDIDLSNNKIFPIISQKVTQVAAQAVGGQYSLKESVKRGDFTKAEDYDRRRGWSQETLFLVKGADYFDSGVEVEAQLEALIVGFAHTFISKIPLVQSQGWREGGDAIEITKIDYRPGYLSLDFTLRSFSIIADRTQRFLGLAGAYGFAILNNATGDVIPFRQNAYWPKPSVFTAPHVQKVSTHFDLPGFNLDASDGGIRKSVEDFSLLIVRREYFDSYRTRQDAKFIF